jgi:prolyl oligopeptidase
MLLNAALTTALLAASAGAAVETLHGVHIEDPHRWLEERTNPAVGAWLDAQMSMTTAYFRGLPVTTLERRLSEVQRVDVVGMPKSRSGRYVYSRRLANENRASICVRDRQSGDRVVFNAERLPDTSSSVTPLALSLNAKILAYGVRDGGEDELEVRFLNLETGSALADILPRAQYRHLEFAAHGLYYVIYSKSVGPRLRYHAMRSEAASDPDVFGTVLGPSDWIGITASEDGSFLAITAGSGHKGNDLLLLNASAPGARPQVVCASRNALFFPAFAGRQLVVHTNSGAPNWRILSMPLQDAREENWTEIVAETDHRIESVAVAGGRILVNYRVNVVSHIAQFDTSGRPLGELRLPGHGTVSEMSGQWSDDEAFVSYTSFLHPATTFRYFVSRGVRDVWYQRVFPSVLDRTEVRQVWFDSPDGTRVPMFLIHRKGLVRSGENPVLLTGYGGFNVSLGPTFSSQIAVWTDMGGVWAIANLRGGGEFGDRWHNAGMLENKQNTFDDFIAAAEWLISKRYTNPRRLAIMGASNGGLLVGAALTQRPDLFGAAVCGMPLLDMLRYQKFGSGPLWVSEYGTAENPKQFEYLRRYSPYHRVRNGIAYPAVLFWTGDSDTRVDPLHARKMAARVQEATSSSRPVLLFHDQKTGHSGGKPLDQQIREQALRLAFLMSGTGMPIASLGVECTGAR